MNLEQAFRKCMRTFFKRREIAGKNIASVGTPIGISSSENRYCPLKYIATDEIKHFGDSVNSSSHISNASLGNDYFVVSYPTFSDPPYRAISIVGRFTGDSIEWMSGDTGINIGIDTSYIDNCPFGDNYFVVNGSNSSTYELASRIGYFTGDSIEWITPSVVTGDTDALFIYGCYLGDSYFVVDYRQQNNPKEGRTMVCHFTGDSIEVVTPEILFNGDTLSVEAPPVALGDNHYVISFNDRETTGSSIVCRFTGDSIELISPVVAFNSGESRKISSAYLGDSHFIITYSDYGNSYYGTARVGYFTGDSIEWKTSEIVFFEAWMGAGSVASNQNNYFSIFFNGTGISASIVKTGYFTGDSIEWMPGDTILFSSTPTDCYTSNFADYIGDGYYLVTYRGDSVNEEAIIARVVNGNKYVGVAGDSASAGDSVIVQFGGIAKGFSNLEKGNTYYLNYTDGTLITSLTTQKVGIAIGDTELLL